MPPATIPQILALDRVPPQPWRNGGGVTRELLAWPSPLEWALRISVADIERDGPFSAFPGIDRWFAVLEGQGVVLQFGTRCAPLGVDSEPLAFDGAAAPDCRLVAGPTRDLNLMVRRGAGRASMARATVGADWTGAAALRAVFTTGPLRLQVDDGDAVTLPPFALAWSGCAAGRRWRLLADDHPPPRAWLLSFESFRQ